MNFKLLDGLVLTAVVLGVLVGTFGLVGGNSWGAVSLVAALVAGVILVVGRRRRNGAGR
jgi:hypothetical protein